MSDKKVNISFACDKWNSMSKIDEQNRYCSLCDKVIHDFSRSKQAISKETYCGYFDVSQVNSIKNSFSFSRTGVYTISLLAALGVSLFQNPIYAQSVESEKQITDNNEDGKITIKGYVRDNDKKYLEDVTVLLELKDSLLQRMKTNAEGYFEIEIDVQKHNIADLEIKFSHPSYLGEDILYSKIKNQENSERNIEVILESTFVNYKNECNVTGALITSEEIKRSPSIKSKKRKK